MKKITGILFVGYLVMIVGVCFAGERSVPLKSQSQGETKKEFPLSYDLPRDQVTEYRILDAEARALRAEATISLREIEEKRSVILEKWKVLVGGDLKDWQLDLGKGKLILNKSLDRK